MPVKMTGAEYKEFEEAPWPEDWWIEDEEILINGEPLFEEQGFSADDIRNTDIITIKGGYIYTEMGMSSSRKSYESYVRAWKKKQSVTKLIVEVTKDGEKEAREEIKKMGYRVL